MNFLPCAMCLSSTSQKATSRSLHAAATAGLPWLITPMTTVPSLELGDLADSTAGTAKTLAPAATPAARRRSGGTCDE